jgi:hypothetical protein
LERAFVLTKEGFVKGAHIELRDRQDATSRYVLAALLRGNEAVVAAIRRELRRVVDVLVDDELIVKAMKEEVIKRDCLEGPDAEAALRRISKATQRTTKVSPRSYAEAPVEQAQMEPTESQASTVTLGEPEPQSQQ